MIFQPLLHYQQHLKYRLAFEIPILTQDQSYENGQYRQIYSLKYNHILKAKLIIYLSYSDQFLVKGQMLDSYHFQPANLMFDHRSYHQYLHTKKVL